MKASSETSSLGAGVRFTSLGRENQRVFSITMDDTKIDYTSMLGLEDRRRRFSEDVVDFETKDSIRLQKLYRQIQRQVYCNQESEETATEWSKRYDSFHFIRKLVTIV